MQRPPYLRWAISGLLVLAIVWVEFAPDGMVEHPYLASSVTPGTPLGDVVEMRRVPAGVFPEVMISNKVSRYSLEQGTPLSPGLVANPDLLAPADWLTIVTGVPTTAVAGSKARLVTIEEPANSVTGVVIATGEEGEVAIPPDSAEAIATAHRRGSLEVLVSVGD
ncbi:MAG: hypothetical protein GEU79_01095 [Acidimicrobiia bacterium]|nr:hypothetical protein [Acidimicrobiia bacterium]